MNIPNPIRILNTYVHPIRQSEAVQAVREAVKQKKKLVLFPVNLHVVAELSKNSVFRQKHQRADILFTDGVPLVWLSKLQKISLPERISGTDVVEELLQKEKRIFLLGSSRAVLEIMKRKYRSVCGVYSPPYSDPWTAKENTKIVRLIKQSKTTILLVGVGPLKQERWIDQYFSKTRALVAVGVGSAFDILSGKTPRAPRWMQRVGLEWAWRIMFEPKRLLGRYVKDFLYLFRVKKY